MATQGPIKDPTCVAIGTLVPKHASMSWQYSSFPFNFTTIIYNQKKEFLKL